MVKRKPNPGPYDIGYKKPPRATQFQRGQSGNPKGRPRGSKNFESQVKTAFGRTIVIRDNGRERRVTVADAILMKLATQALSTNNMVAIRLALGLLQTSEPESKASEIFSSETDRELLLSYLAENAPEPAAKRPRRARRKGGDL